MIDLHTHTILSDGDLIASELVRRAQVKGYEAIALTDHVDMSNIDFVITRVVKASKALSLHWPIKVIPGAEITHAPLEEIKGLIRYARASGARVIVVHGETLSEPVIPGTNKRAIECKADILAHPGNLSEDDARLAEANGVYIEVTTRKLHSMTNTHIRDLARKTGIKLVLNTDTHSPQDLIDDGAANTYLDSLGFTKEEKDAIFNNSKSLVASLR